MDQNIIYFVVVFYLKPNEKSYKRIRTWAWYKDEKDAERCIKENWTDIYEDGYYNYALIEPMSQGICCTNRKDNRWFKVDFKSIDSEGYDEYNVEETEVPERFKHYVGFSYS